MHQVNEYPGKTDHYRKCLEVIADAQGNERPGIKQFLGTGTVGASVYSRNVGHSSRIRATCSREKRHPGWTAEHRVSSLGLGLSEREEPGRWTIMTVADICRNTW